MNTCGFVYDKGHIKDPFYLRGWTKILACMSIHMPSKLWGEITYPFPHFNGNTVEVWEWANKSTRHFIMDVIIIIPDGVKVNPC